jgi:hypothetical protein
MGLKGDRYIPDGGTDISFFMNEVATRGGCTVYSTLGSGAALDQSEALVTYAADPTGKRPAGILLSDMVNYDLTKRHLNWHKDEVQIGSKVPLAKKGWVLTNMLVASTTPAVSQKCYVRESGLLSNSGNSQEQKVGTFGSKVDEDGYAKVFINID